MSDNSSQQAAPNEGAASPRLGGIVTAANPRVFPIEGAPERAAGSVSESLAFFAGFPMSADLGPS